MAGYQYRGTGRELSPAEIAAANREQLANRQRATNGTAGDTGTPAIRPAPPPPDAPQIKGAVKVDGFPSQDKYGFAVMARDGGVWRIDHDEFGVTHHAVRLAAPKWAKANGFKLKTELHDGHIYVQFSRDGA